MLDASPSAIDPPSKVQSLSFRCKAVIFQLRRSISNRVESIPRYRPTNALVDEAVVAQSVTPLWTSHEAIERNLIAGKIHNLRLAAQCIHGIELPANAPFSFWAQVGRPTAQKGYVNGRELRQGCVIPSVGGGLCQLSNALYSVALDAGLEIIERHAHTQVIRGSLAEIGRDATVFWNYVDLRFRTPEALRIEVSLTDDALVVQLKGTQSPLATGFTIAPMLARSIAKSKSCQTCGVTSCSRSLRQPLPLKDAPVAYFLDEYWPEFDQFIGRDRKSIDLLAIPLDGRRWLKSNYAWNMSGFEQVKQAHRVTLHRSIASRFLSPQGRSRQQVLLSFDQQLARWYASHLNYRILHCVVMQNLLPFLWQGGHLGGRSFDVLMTRLPLFALQERLDRAHQNHLESSTLNDFRVDSCLLEAERQALQSARQIITPHTEIATLFPEKTVLLDWQLPLAKTPRQPGNTILFPASTVGRKGAYELRQAVKNLGLTVRVLGQELEGANFWDGVSVEQSPVDPFSGVGLVVLPAYVEHRPRLLLSAIAAGIPIIASPACGLGKLDGVTTVPTGDAIELQQAIARLIGVGR